MQGDVWQDVQMDIAAARAAQQALLDVAREVERLATERAGLASEAQAGWLGPQRELFDQRLAPVLDRSVHLAHALRRAREAIGQELTAAATEQARRDAARAELRDDGTDVRPGAGALP